jgi:hypothetical protein
VDLLGLADHEAVLHELADILACSTQLPCVTERKDRTEKRDNERIAVREHVKGQGVRSAQRKETVQGGCMDVKTSRQKQTLLSPSPTRAVVNVRELAIEISLISLGSSQIFLLPHLRTEDARRF